MKCIVDVSEKFFVDYCFIWWWIMCFGFVGFDDGVDYEGKVILIWCVSVLMMWGFFVCNYCVGIVFVVGGL